MRFFEKKYRVISNDIGPVGPWIYRNKYVAGWYAAYFEYVEAMAGIKSKGWRVQERVSRGNIPKQTPDRSDPS